MAFSQYVVTWSNVAVCYSSELYILTLSMPGDNLRNTFYFYTISRNLVFLNKT